MGKSKPDFACDINGIPAVRPSQNCKKVCESLSKGSSPARLYPDLSDRAGDFVRDRTVSVYAGNTLYFDRPDKDPDARIALIPIQDETWLGVCLNFRYSVGHVYLSSVALRGYRGPAYEEKQLVFRAEWDFRVHEAAIRHAQPHWHLLNDDENGLPWSRVHFAMSARWHESGKDGERDGVAPSRWDEVYRWLKRSRDYVANQIQYMAE